MSNGQEEVQQQILSFLDGDDGVLLKKSDWDQLKDYLQNNLTQDQLEQIKEMNIHELEVQVGGE